MTTLRQHLEEINAALVTGEYGRIDQHVKAIRKILDASKRTFGKYEGVIVPDPKESS